MMAILYSMSPFSIISQRKFSKILSGSFTIRSEERSIREDGNCYSGWLAINSDPVLQTWNSYFCTPVPFLSSWLPFSIRCDRALILSGTQYCVILPDRGIQQLVLLEFYRGALELYFRCY